VIGVVTTTKSRTLGEPEQPQIYISLEAEYPNLWGLFGTVLAVKTHGQPAEMARVLRQQVTDLDPAMAVYNVQTMREYIDKRCCYRGCVELCSAFWTHRADSCRDRSLRSDELHGTAANKGNRHPHGDRGCARRRGADDRPPRHGSRTCRHGFRLGAVADAEPGARAVSVWDQSARPGDVSGGAGAFVVCGRRGGPVARAGCGQGGCVTIDPV